ncbi:vWA domain-containing protein [Parvularcula maris]|uniref:VWA domain-containing protein n=1 Tax=Parvularcula maris TaxID=2965077 RepID=A0A9X2LAH1_9PROT|nr:vWA domain-containing protein [Parvularcula maris]MCQ8185981.1 VWA domain-containing protein [Parvularcula maris]
MRKLILGLTAAASAVLAGCGQPPNRSTGVYMLIDTSGTYTKEIQEAQAIINVILATLEPSDAFAVARVDTASFSEKDIVAKMQFDDRPSVANQQKRQFKEDIDSFVGGVAPSSHTDITGGVLQASEFLMEKGSGRKVIFIFSDLQEDLPEGYVRDLPLDLRGVTVVALNVTKLRTDNIDPRLYQGRIEDWRTRVEAGGGTFRVINDLDGLALPF